MTNLDRYIEDSGTDGGTELSIEPPVTPENDKTRTLTSPSQNNIETNISPSKLQSPSLSSYPSNSQKLMANCSQSSMDPETFNPKTKIPSNRRKSFISHNNEPGGQIDSACGDVQDILKKTKSWSKVAHHDSTLPAEAKQEVTERSTGILSLFSRKKGSNHHAKPRERGVLGKEGARVIINKG